MKCLVVLVLAVHLVFSGTVLGDTVVVPQDEKPFKVMEKDIVRLTGSGIAASIIKATVVNGPASIARENDITERKNGGPIIGVQKREFEIKLSGKGNVKVTITVTPPNGAPKAVTFEFEVQ